MLKDEQTIVFLNAYHYVLLKLLVTREPLAIKNMWETINLGGFKSLISNPSKDMTYKSVRELRLAGLIYKACPVTHQLRLSDNKKVRTIVDLIEASKFIGLVQRENSCLNYGDLFLRELSPENKLFSGEGSVFYNTMRHNHSYYERTLPFTWLEKYRTEHVWFEYKLSDDFYEVVKNWREITRLYNSFN